MSKKAPAPKLQEDIQTDEELYIFLERPGLLVLDIYSEWCGPCLGMVGSLRKFKLNVGGDNLSFAICKADTIEAFKRFRRKSEPTWLFVTNQKAVNILFGSNVPKLLAVISSELRRLKLETKAFYDLSEYQPEELIEYQTKEEAKKKASALELKQKERERLTYLNLVTDTIMENFTDMGVTIFGPQINRDLIKRILQKAEQLKIQCRERKIVKISQDHFKTIHFNCSNPLPDDVLEHLEDKEVFVCFWKVLGTGPEVPKLLQEFANELQLSKTQLGYGDNDEDVVIPPIIEPIDVEVDIEIEEDDDAMSKEKLIVSQKPEQNEANNVEKDHDNLSTDTFHLDSEDNKVLDDQQSFEAEMVKEVQKRKTRTKQIRIPAIWVPNNQRTHAALIYIYFRNQTKTFLPPDPQPEPPYVVMAFDAYKKKDLMLHVGSHKQAVPMYGFFTSDDADNAKYIANSVDKYRPVTTNDKIVLKVQKATSRTMLELVTYGPSYVSPNQSVGEEDVMKFFPSTYKTAQQEAEEEVKMLNSPTMLQEHGEGSKNRKPHKTNDQKSSDKVALKEIQDSEYISANNPGEASSDLNTKARNTALAA